MSTSCGCKGLSIRRLIIGVIAFILLVSFNLSVYPVLEDYMQQALGFGVLGTSLLLVMHILFWCAGCLIVGYCVLNALGLDYILAFKNKMRL